MKVFLLVALFIIAGCTTLGIKSPVEVSGDSLPTDFTVHIYSDGTSSGATRYYNSYITFRGDEVITANRSYFGSGGNGENYCNEILDSNLGNWSAPVWKGIVGDLLDKNGGEPQSCPGKSYLNRTILVTAIGSEELRPNDGNCHYKNCYTILE
jgi:hypothetical protein